MKRVRSMRWENLLFCAVSIAVAGCAAVPAVIPVIVVSDTPAAKATMPAATSTAAAIDLAEPTASPAPSGQRLRLTNSGTADILKLVVLFPGGRVSFGELAAGQTSEYRDIPGGVYGYAAFEYELNGQTLQQPVIDWVGESPMDGSAFTYTIRLTPTEGGRSWIELVNVTRDE